MTINDEYQAMGEIYERSCRAIEEGMRFPFLRAVPDVPQQVTKKMPKPPRGPKERYAEAIRKLLKQAELQNAPHP